MSNYIKNKILNDLMTELEKNKSKKNEPESISFKEIEEQSENEVISKSSKEVYRLPKSRIKIEVNWILPDFLVILKLI